MAISFNAFSAWGRALEMQKACRRTEPNSWLLCASHWQVIRFHTCTPTTLGWSMDIGGADNRAEGERRQDRRQEATALPDADSLMQAVGMLSCHLRVCFFNSKRRAVVVFGNFKNVSKKENQWGSLRVCYSRPCGNPTLHPVTGLLFSDSYHFEYTQKCTWPPRVNTLHKCQHLLINVNWPLLVCIPLNSCNKTYLEVLHFYQIFSWQFFFQWSL